MDTTYGYIVRMRNEMNCFVSLAVKGAIDSWQAEEKGIDYFYERGENWECSRIVHCEIKRDFEYWIPSCYDIIDLTEGE